MKIVVLDGYALNPGDLSWDGLRKYGEVSVYDKTPADLVLERADGAEIVLTNKTPLGQAILNRLGELEYIGVLATGYNIVDTATAQKQGITITNIPDYGGYSVAQMTLALLLELCHHVQRHSDSATSGKWAASPHWCYWDFPLVELAGKTMGIIGFGSIGQKVGDMATAFGMKVIGAARHQSDQSHRKNFKWRSIPDLLKESDVVSIHCQLTTETKGLISRESLLTMKPTAFLLNTARGPIVVDEDLACALNDGIIAGAALDVLSIEPPAPDNPLFKARNCLVTPHMAWATKEARTRLMNMAVENVALFLEGKAINVVR